MTLPKIQNYLTSLPGVTVADNMGYRFFSYGADAMRPFVTLIEADNDYDRVSNLDREGVFRLNVGVGRETFCALFPEPGEWDYTALDCFLPHPEYAAFHFLCVLNPQGENATRTLRYIDEAYALAKRRFEEKESAQ